MLKGPRSRGAPHPAFFFFIGSSGGGGNDSVGGGGGRSLGGGGANVLGGGGGTELSGGGGGGDGSLPFISMSIGGGGIVESPLLPDMVVRKIKPDQVLADEYVQVRILFLYGVLRCVAI